MDIIGRRLPTSVRRQHTDTMMLPIPDKDPATGLAMPEWHAAPSSVDGGWNDWRHALDKRG